jgi:hypothetical protein
MKPTSWPWSSRSKRGQSEESGAFDQVTVLYNRLSQRLRTRLNTRGKLPGHLWLISSARFPNDFTERKEREAREDARIFVRHYAMWDTKPKDLFILDGNGDMKTFDVEVGDSTRRSRLLTKLEGGGYAEGHVHPERVVHVPLDLYEDFRKDTENCVRNYAGISVLSIRPFIAQRESIRKMFDLGMGEGLRHPFTQMEVTLQSPDPELEQWKFENLHWITREVTDIKERVVMREGKPVMERVLFPALYYGHIDLSKNHDATGFCVGHVVGTKKVERFDAALMKTVAEELPIVRVDIVLRVIPPHNGEIDIRRVRGLLYQLRSQGIEFGKVSFDTFASQESVKELKEKGFRCENFSVDTDNTPYEALKTAIYDERILCYECPKLEMELAQLERTKTKIDHPPGSSKDVADCLAAVVYHCEEGWRSGAGVGGLFKFGPLVEPDEPRIHSARTAAYKKVNEGTPLTDADEDAILWADFIDQGLL